MQRSLADRETFNRFQTKQFGRLGLEVASTDLGQHDWPCPSCHRTFGTYQGLRCHERQAHGKLHVSNQYAILVNDLWTCASCLFGFQTRNNLVRHLKSHKKCLDLICAVCPQGFGSDPEFLKGLKFHDANMEDAVQLAGPLEARPTKDAVQLVGALIAGGALSEGLVRPAKKSCQDRHDEVVRNAFTGLCPSKPPAVDVGAKVPRLLRMRVFLIGFGGRRRHGDTFFSLNGISPMANGITDPSCAVLISSSAQGTMRLGVRCIFGAAVSLMDSLWGLFKVPHARHGPFLVICSWLRGRAGLLRLDLEIFLSGCMVSPLSNISNWRSARFCSFQVSP